MSPEEKFAGVDLKFIDSDDLETVEECDYVMLALDDIVGSIEDQLGRARSETAKTGLYEDSDWFRGAIRALKSTRRARNMTQNRRGVISRQERQSAQLTYERAFVEAAKQVLDEKTYLRIWSIAISENRGNIREG